MKAKIKKTIKYIVLSILSVILLILLVIGISLNFIFTPEKVTPKVVEAINKNLNAELKVKSIELTFFSTFPNFSLEIEDGVIINQLDLNSSMTYTKKDSLIAFASCRISLNPIAFLTSNKIEVHHILLDKPHIYAYVNNNGIVNWDILKTETEKDTTTVKSDTTAFKADLNIEDVTITNGNLYYDDRTTQMYASLHELNLTLNAIFNDETINLGLKVDTQNVIFWQKGETLVKDVSCGFVTDLSVNRDTKILDIHNTKAQINNIEFIVEGQLIPDKEKKELDVSMDLNLEVPSLKTVMSLIPESILKQGKDLTTKGSVSFHANIDGTYGNGKLPTAIASLSIKDGGIQYKDMPNKIDLIETEMLTFLDLSKKTSSFVEVNNFKLRGTSTNIVLRGKADNILDNAKIIAKANGTLDFATLAKTLPLKPGIDIMGIAEVDLDGMFYSNDIMNNDYGKIDAVGKLSLTDVKFSYKTDSLVFETTQSKAVFGQKQKSNALSTEESKVFGGVIDLSGLKLIAKNQLEATVDNVYLGFGSTPWKDSTQIANMKSTLRIKNAKVNLGDTIKGMIGNASAIINLNPSIEDKSIPAVHTEFYIDSTGVSTKGSFIGIKEGEYNFDLIRTGDKRWPATGYIAFNNLYAYSPLFPLLLKMPKTKVSVRPGLIELTDAKMEMGRSDIEVTGKLYDLEKTLLERKTLRAELTVNSDTIDVNELIKTLNEGVTLDEETMTELITNSDETVKTQDSTSMKTFVVPKGIDFTFESKLSKVLFGDMEIDDVHGLITVKDQNIHLANLQMKTMAANMATSLRYQAKDTTEASMDFDFELTDIDIANLVSLMPALDTLFPMATSFEGKVNFKMQGKSDLDANMGVVIPSLQTIARIEGFNLVVLDGETFSELSKMLMFKNKEKNIIDSLSFEMMVHGNEMEVFPSLVTVDRYKVAIGGTHKLDMTYNYHVSVLKSPMPFKAGIDLSGDLEDYDFKITKAKYKYLFSDKKKQRQKADSSLIKRKMEILEQLKF